MVWLTIAAKVLLGFIAPLGVLHAQEKQPNAQAAASAQPTAEKPASGDSARAEEASREPKEQESKEKSESSEDALRHSTAVKLIAKWTHLSVNTTYWLCVVFNFAIVAYAIFSFSRKNLPGFFQNRTQTIQKRIEEARKTSEDARRRLNEVEGRLSRLDSEIAGMRREAEDNAQTEESRVRAAVEDERKRIVASAEQEISTIANAARRDLKAYAGALAVDLAEKKIRVDKGTDQSLVREFTAQLGKDGN